MNPGLFMPEATTSWSTRPNRLSAASSIALASSRLSGRRTIVSASPPTSRTSAATSSSSFCVPEASRSLPPRAPSAMAQPRPKAPDAPVTIATLPLTSKSDSGLRKGSEIIVSPTRLESKRLLRIEHRNHTQRAALAVRPAPWKCKEGAALACDLVDVATDILDTRNAIGHHDLVRRLPVRKILDDVASGFGLVFVIEMRLCGSGTMRSEKSTERMIERLHVDADELDAALDDPFRSFLIEARRIGVIVRVVTIFEVTAGVDHQDIVAADFGFGSFEILGRDDTPFALGDRNHDAGAEETPKWITRQRRLVLLHMDRRIHMRATMHDAFELLHQEAILGVEFEHAHIEVRARRPLRHAVAPWMGEIVVLNVFGARWCHRVSCLYRRFVG